MRPKGQMMPRRLTEVLQYSNLMWVPTFLAAKYLW